jgi:hypothetical protein
MVLGAAIASLAGCATNVSTDYNSKVGFSELRTYALVSPKDSTSHQLLDDRIREAVVGQLGAKGMKETDRDHADVLVGFGVVDRTRAEIHTDDGGWGPAWGWRYFRYGVPWPLDTRVEDIETYTDGTVVLCMIDAKTHRVVWQGQAADVLSLPVNNAQRADVDIDRAVAKILDKFPPRTNA